MSIFNRLLFWIIIIFICAAVFRLTNLDLIEFKLDEANTFFAAVKFYSEPYLAQNAGVSSSTLYNMPLFYYLITILAAPFKNPQAISFLIGLINSIMVALFYLIVKKYYGNLTAVFASLLMAFSPWMILYSKKIWGPDLILLFAVPAFYFIHRLIIDRKPISIFGLSLSLALLFQLHFSAIVMAVVSAAVIVFLRAKISWKGLILGLIIGLIPLIPYFTQESFSCAECILPQAERFFDPNNFYRGLQMINGSDFESVLGDDYVVFANQYPMIKLFQILFIFEFLLIFVGGWYLFKDKKLRLLLLYVAVPALVAFVTQTPARIYYYLATSPFIFLVYAFGISHLGGVVKRHLRGVSITIITIIIIINVIFEVLFYSFISQKQTIQGDYGPIFRITERIAEEKLQFQKNSPEYDLIKADFYLKLLGNQVAP